MYGLTLRPKLTRNDWLENVFGDDSWLFKKQEDDFVGEFDVPGFGEGDIEITVKNGVMTLCGQKETRKINYSMTVPKGADVENGEATIKNGVLTIKLPLLKSEKPKQIKIKSA